MPVRLLPLVALLLGVPALGAPPTVAVSYFDNDTGDASLAPLSKGLADMLITDLSNVSAVTVVERAKLNSLLEELKLSKSKFIDPKTAQKLGKGLAAQYVLTGSYLLSKNTLRVDARLLRVDTGAVLGAQKVEGPKDEFFALEKELVELLVKTLDLKLPFSEKGKLRSNQTESFEAWSKYSAGLDASDRGDAKRAQELFLAALQADPNYRAAKGASDRLAALYTKVDTDQAKGWDAQFRTLNPKAADFTQKVEALLVEADTTRSEGMKQKLALLVWLAERDLYPQSIPQLNRVALDAVALAGRSVECPNDWELLVQTCDYFAARVPKDPSVLNMCRSHLETINRFKKTPSQVDYMKESCAKNIQAGLAQDDENWMTVLARNRGGIAQLMRIYASKAKRP